MSEPLTWSRVTEKVLRAEVREFGEGMKHADALLLLAELDATRARLAEVEAERDRARKAAITTDDYQKAEREWRLAVARANAAVDSAESRLSRLRPVVRAAVVVESNTGSIMPGVRVPMEVDRASFTDLVRSVDKLDPSDRRWALGGRP